MTGKKKRGSSGGHGPIIDTAPCESLKLSVQLVSPQPAVVTTLQVNEVLLVDLVSMKGQYVIQVVKNGEAVGGLPSGESASLRNCIKQGHKYKATVLSVSQGQVKVFIEHA